MKTKQYVNEARNEREMHGQHGSALPGGVIELTDHEFETFTQAGYALTPVTPPPTTPPAPKREAPKKPAADTP